MPGRGDPWREGGHVDDTIISEDIKDGSISEADLDSALQAKVNSGGGGGGGWAEAVFDSTTGGSKHYTFSLDDPQTSGESGDRRSLFPAAGKIVKMSARKLGTASTQSGNSTVRVRINGALNPTNLSFDATSVTTESQTTEIAISANQDVEIQADTGTITGGTLNWVLTVQYAFD